MKLTTPISRQAGLIQFAAALLLSVFGSTTGLAWNYLTPLTNLVVCPGDTAAFSTVASGPTPYKFQWWKNGVVISGQTNSSLTLSHVSAADTATYSVKLTGGYNCVTNSATLTVRTPVTATPLTNEARAVGATAFFSTTASGTGPFSYLWKKNGTLISGATGSSLTLTNLTLNASATYSVVVAGPCNSVTNSASLTVDVCFPSVDVVLVIDRSGSMSGKPFSDARQACSNFVNNLYFTTNADQAALASYNTNATLDQKLTNSLLALDQAISVLPAAGGCTSISAGLQTGQAELLSARHRPLAMPVLVLLSDGQPTGTDTPSNALYQATQAKNAGTLVFTVGLGTNIDGALLAGIASAPGDYFYTTNSSQLTALFNTISTSICRPPTNITTLGPSNLTVCAGATVTFNVSASGCDSFAYQWEKSGLRLAGRTASSLTLTNVSAGDAALYAVEVSSACRTVTNSATLTVNTNVAVITPPVDRSACPGGSATFSVSAIGTGLGYQWYRGANVLLGRTASSLLLTNLGTADSGSYGVVVSGTCGNAVSNSATLTVNTNVAVITPPVDRSACPGGSATFSVSAIGTGLGYQWYKGANVLSGRTASSLLLTNLGTADSGSYGVVVSGTCGNAVSNSATLTVNTNVAVITPPVDRSACPGGSATFSVSAIGTGLSYQWYRGANVLSGRTASSLLLTNLGAADGGSYGVVVSGACGNAVSNSATLTVNTNVVVITPPGDRSACPGGSATFSVSAIGTGLSYQWYRGANVLSGRTASSLLLTNLGAADGGSYGVVVSGACGNAVSNSATLTVNTNVAVITPPGDQSACPGGSATFSVSAIGTGLGYQWYKGANVLSGRTASSLLLTNLGAADGGSYGVVVSGACGNAVSNSATLTVNTNVAVITPPGDQSACPGGSATFSVSAIGTGLGYQWFKGANVLLGRTASSLLLTNLGAADGGSYGVVVSGACGNAVSNSATLTVNTNVAVITPPGDQSACPGGSATFSVSAIGTGLGYQWYKGANLLLGRTAGSLLLTNLATTDGGIYGVVVSGTCGNTVSNSATLTVNTNVAVITPPGDQSACPGGSATFSVSAIGTGLGYQWYKGANVLSGRTASSLLLTNLGTADGGSYGVVVSGTCGNAVSNSATLTVNTNVAVITPPGDQSACPGGSATFSVSAIGTGLGYQWYKGANVLSGRTASSLLLTNLGATDGGIYGVVVSGTCGNTVSNSATLTVNTNVAVITPPGDQSACPGGSATFSVSAIGTGLGYQWYKGADVLSGRTASSLLLTNLGASDAGSYGVVISGTCGNALSNSATLTVNTNVAVITPPGDRSACPGGSATFSVSAIGTGLGYQWYKGANVLSGRTASSLLLTNLGAADGGTYGVVISGTCGNALSNSATLTVNTNVAVITPPGDRSACPGGSATFSVSAIGTGLGYQWYKGANVLLGRTASSLLLTNLATTDGGIYGVVVSGTCGNAVSNSATLTVNTNVAVITPPGDQSACPGGSATFSVSAIGTGLGYQWYKGANVLLGRTASSLLLTNLGATDGGAYGVVVSGTCGNAVSNSATLTVNTNVAVITPPGDQSACPGGSATFSVSAIGTGLGYQWYKGANVLSGRTASSLLLTNLGTADGGIYGVVVSGTCGNAVSNSATLTVNPGLIVASAPADQTVCAGASVAFSIGATGVGSYQWYKGDGLLTNQTASTLLLTNVSTGDSGAYKVVLSGACGSLTNDAVLTVNPLTAATPLANALKNLGDSVTFATRASGTPPFAYVWQRNGTNIVGATTSSLTLTNLAYTNAATYSVEVTGACNTDIKFANLSINHPPTVSILSPTNGAVFISPANFTVLAQAADEEGADTITNVSIFLYSTNKLGQATNDSCLVWRTNLAAGTYTFTATATDNMGATSNSTPVTVTVVDRLPLSVVSAMTLDWSTGRFRQTVRVSNPTYSILNAVRLYIYGLLSGQTVYNPTGYTNGIPYVQSAGSVAPGGYVDFVLYYIVTAGPAPAPTFKAVLLPPGVGGLVITNAVPQPISRWLIQPNGSVRLEMSTISGGVYYVQYTHDLLTWKTAQPAILGIGGATTWLDEGQPSTDSAPNTQDRRFYRLLKLP